MCLIDLLVKKRYFKKIEANIPDNNAFRECYDFNS